jgi:predicted RNase H-like HicB family nuclease
MVRLTIELEQEQDGRWIAEVGELPGVMVYASTPRAAYAAVKALALRVLADRMEHGEADPLGLDMISFEQSRAAGL